MVSLARAPNILLHEVKAHGIKLLLAGAPNILLHEVKAQGMMLVMDKAFAVLQPHEIFSACAVVNSSQILNLDHEFRFLLGGLLHRVLLAHLRIVLVM